MMKFKSSSVGTLSWLGSAVLAFLAVLSQQPYVFCQAQTLSILVQQTPELSTLLTALNAVNLGLTLNGPGPFTVFAPVNDAFAAVDQTLLTKLTTEAQWRVHLGNLLLYHVAGGEFNSTQLVDDEDGELAMSNIYQDTVSLTVTAGGLLLNDNVNVTDPDIPADNGIAHVVDGVLIPPFLIKTIIDVVQQDLTTPLVTLTDIVGLTDALRTTDGITVFVPSAAAAGNLPQFLFAYLTTTDIGRNVLQTILRHHVVAQVLPSTDLSPGDLLTLTTLNDSEDRLQLFNNAGDITVDGRAMVTDVDLLAVNGIVHGIDVVLIPDSLSFFRYVVDNNSLTNFTEITIAMGILEVLLEGTYTLFTPTNEAFDNVDSELLEKLQTAPWQAHLMNLLMYHAAEGRYNASQVVSQTSLGMLNEESINITTTTTSGGDTVVNLNNAETTVIETNLNTPFGIAHVIDAVLLPAFLSNNIVSVALSELSTLAELVVLAELDGALSSTDVTVFGPTNAAFEALGSETLELLKSDEGRDTLIQTLSYHVVGLVIPSVAIEEGDTTVESLLDGFSLNVTLDANGDITVNEDAEVVQRDVLASNGIVHVINQVLTPPGTANAPTDSPGGGPGEGPAGAPTASPTLGPSAGTMASPFLAGFAIMILSTLFAMF